MTSSDLDDKELEEIRRLLQNRAAKGWPAIASLIPHLSRLRVPALLILLVAAARQFDLPVSAESAELVTMGLLAWILRGPPAATSVTDAPAKKP